MIHLLLSHLREAGIGAGYAALIFGPGALAGWLANPAAGISLFFAGALWGAIHLLGD